MKEAYPIDTATITSVLQGGSELLSLLDPKGLLRFGFVSKLKGSLIPGDRYVYDIRVDFDFDSAVSFHFEENAGEQMVYPLVFSSGAEKVSSLGSPVSGLSEALKQACSVSPRLAFCLAMPAPESINNEVFRFSHSDFLAKVQELAFGGIESEPGLCGSFNVYEIEFERDGHCNIHLCSPFRDGYFEISFVLEKDCLKEKNVYLCRKFGNGYGIKCECFVTEEHRKIPSLNLAFNLSRDLVAKPIQVVSVPQTKLEQIKVADNIIVKKVRKNK